MKRIKTKYKNFEIIDHLGEVTLSAYGEISDLYDELNATSDKIGEMQNVKYEDFSDKNPQLVKDMATIWELVDRQAIIKSNLLYKMSDCPIAECHKIVNDEITLKIVEDNMEALSVRDLPSEEITEFQFHKYTKLERKGFKKELDKLKWWEFKKKKELAAKILQQAEYEIRSLFDIPTINNRILNELSKNYLEAREDVIKENFTKLPYMTAYMCVEKGMDFADLIKGGTAELETMSQYAEDLDAYVKRMAELFKELPITIIYGVRNFFFRTQGELPLGMRMSLIQMEKKRKAWYTQTYNSTMTDTDLMTSFGKSPDKEE